MYLISQLPSQTVLFFQVLSFVTLVGAYSADAPLKLPRQVVLILNGASITASVAFPNDALGLIVANGAHFSAVVSAYGPKSAILDCAGTIGPSGVHIYNSSYFNIDGITIRNCGGNAGAISIIGHADYSIGNSTSILNSVVSNAQGHGIYISQACRPVIYNSNILNSVGAGVYAISSYGPILSGNIISGNGAQGVFIGLGTSLATVRGNVISTNIGAGIALTNAASYPKTTRSAILGNQIVSNGLYSILFAVDSKSQVTDTVIVGNTINGNSYGLGVVEPGKNGITKTIIAGNADSDGIMPSFLALTNGYAGSGCSGNYFLDPLNRGVLYASPIPPSGNAIIAYKTNS